MKLEILTQSFSVCKIATLADADLTGEFCFIARTDEEISLVCPSQTVPANALQVDEGWKAFRVQGVLDFSLIGILAEISGILAKQKISVFAISTYNTDYILTKAENLIKALEILRENGYQIS